MTGVAVTTMMVTTDNCTGRIHTAVDPTVFSGHDTANWEVYYNI